MFGELAVLEADDIGGDRGGGTAVAGEATVRDDIVALGHDQLVLIAQRRGQRLDQGKQALAARCDVSAVLDVAVGPEPFGGRVVALVKERIERLQDDRFVVLGLCIAHLIPLARRPWLITPLAERYDRSYYLSTGIQMMSVVVTSHRRSPQRRNRRDRLLLQQSWPPAAHRTWENTI